MREGRVRFFEGISIDCTRWPLILWESPSVRVSDESSGAALGWLEELWRTTPAGTKSFTLLDLSRMQEIAPATQRKYAAEFMDRNRNLQRRASVGGAIVATSALVRGAITAVFWLRSPAVETRVVPTREAGLDYGFHRLATSSAALSLRLRDLRAKLPDPRSSAVSDMASGRASIVPIGSRARRAAAR
jgi:hypothetical protein